MSAGLPQHLTLDYLRALLSRGVEKTTVTEEARMVLRKSVSYTHLTLPTIA